MMLPTPEEARAELIRRGVIKPEKETITASESRQELMRRGKYNPAAQFSGDINYTNKVNDAFPKPPQPTSEKSIPRDLAEMVLNAGPEGKKMIAQIPQDIYSGISDSGGITRMGENLDYGALRTLRGLVNLPAKGASYIQSKTGVNNPVSKFRIEPGEFEKRMEADARPGDALMRMIGGAAPLAPIAASLPVIGGTLLAEANDSNPILGALMGYVGPKVVEKTGNLYRRHQEKKNLPKLIEKENLANEQLKTEEYNINNANDILMQLEDIYGFKTPQGVQGAKNKGTQKATDLQKKLEEMQQFEYSTTNPSVQESGVPATDKGTIPAEEQPLALPPSTKVPERQAAEELFLNTKKQLGTAEEGKKYHEEHVKNERERLINEAENEVNEKLGQGKTYQEKVGSHIKEKQNAVEKSIKDEYDNIRKELSQHEISVADISALAEIEKALKPLYGKIPESEFKKIASETAKANNVDVKNMKASDLYSEYKTARFTQNKLQSRGNAYGVSEADRIDLWKQADEARSHADSLFEILKENVPQETFNRILANNKRFVEEQIPMRNSNVWEHISKNGKFPTKDIIDKLGGEEAANKIMRQQILSDPEIAALTVGGNVAGKQNIWHEYNEAMLPYLEAAPHIVESMGRHKEALRPYEDYLSEHPNTNEFNIRHERAVQAHETAKETLEKATQENEVLTKRWASAEKELVAEIEAAKKGKITAKTEEGKIAQQEAVKKQKEAEERLKKAQKQKVAIKNTEENIKRLQNRNKELESIYEEYKKAANAKNLALKEKMEAESRAKVAKKNVEESKAKIESNKSELTKMIASGLSFLTGEKVLEYIFK